MGDEVKIDRFVIANPGSGQLACQRVNAEGASKLSFIDGGGCVEIHLCVGEKLTLWIPDGER